MFLVYGFGVLNNNRLFNNFQANSEELVVGKIYADQKKIDTGNFGLVSIGNKKENNGGTESSNLIKFIYPTSFGLQGYIFSFISNELRI